VGWLRLVGSIKLQVFFAKEPYKRDDILQKESYNFKEPTNRSHPIVKWRTSWGLRHCTQQTVAVVLLQQFGMKGEVKTTKKTYFSMMNDFPATDDIWDIVPSKLLQLSSQLRLATARVLHWCSSRCTCTNTYSLFAVYLVYINLHSSHAVCIGYAKSVALMFARLRPHKHTPIAPIVYHIFSLPTHTLLVYSIFGMWRVLHWCSRYGTCTTRYSLHTVYLAAGMRRGGGLGSSTIFKTLMSPAPRRKWYLTTGRRAH